jgi:hypothetical protein
VAVEERENRERDLSAATAAVDELREKQRRLGEETNERLVARGE